MAVFRYLDLVWMGNFKKASQMAHAAMRVDPVDYNSYAVLYFVSLYSGQLDDATNYLKERKRVFGNSRGMTSMEMRLQFDKGNYQKVIQQCDSLKAKGESLSDQGLFLLTSAYFKAKKIQQSNDILRQLKSIDDPNGDAFYDIALAYAGRHETDSCFRYLVKSHQKNGRLLKTLKIEPILKGLQKDPRYIKLYQECGFDKY